MDEHELRGGATRAWYSWHEPLAEDREGYAVCGRCGSSYRASPSLEKDLLAAADHVLRQAGCMTLTERLLERELDEAPGAR